MNYATTGLPQPNLSEIHPLLRTSRDTRRMIFVRLLAYVSGLAVLAALLADLFGGTPSNLAISLLESGRTEVIAGVNLPMLIRLESARKTMELRAAVIAAKEAGQKYISVASEMLGVGP